MYLECSDSRDADGAHVCFQILSRPQPHKTAETLLNKRECYRRVPRLSNTHYSASLNANAKFHHLSLISICISIYIYICIYICIYKWYKGINAFN